MASPYTVTMQYIVLFSHLMVQLPVGGRERERGKENKRGREEGGGREGEGTELVEREGRGERGGGSIALTVCGVVPVA